MDPVSYNKTIGARQVTPSHAVARMAPAQGSFPSMATRPDMTCGETAGDLQKSLNFNLWEFSHYMTVLVLAERNHLSCHSVKLKSLRSSTAPWLSISKQVPWMKPYPQRLQCFYIDCTKFIGINTDVFLLNIYIQARLAQPGCDPFSHSSQARSSALSHFIHSQTPLRSTYCSQQNGWDFFKPLLGDNNFKYTNCCTS